MTEQPITLDELCERLERAANSELFCIDIMECGAARVGAPLVFTAAVKDVRRQGRALGLAHQIAKALRDNPTLALGLGVEGLAELARLEPGAAAEPQETAA